MRDLERLDPLVLRTAQTLASYEAPAPAPEPVPYLEPTCFADIEMKMRDFESPEEFARSENFLPEERVLEPDAHYYWQGHRVIGIIAEHDEAWRRVSRISGVWCDDGMKYLGVTINDLEYCGPREDPRSEKGELRTGHWEAGPFEHQSEAFDASRYIDERRVMSAKARIDRARERIEQHRKLSSSEARSNDVAELRQAIAQTRGVS